MASFVRYLEEKKEESGKRKEERGKRYVQIYHIIITGVGLPDGDGTGEAGAE